MSFHKFGFFERGIKNRFFKKICIAGGSLFMLYVLNIMVVFESRYSVKHTSKNGDSAAKVSPVTQMVPDAENIIRTHQFKAK